jgi:hypothetical protein
MRKDKYIFDLEDFLDENFKSVDVKLKKRRLYFNSLLKLYAALAQDIVFLLHDVV